MSSIKAISYRQSKDRRTRYWTADAEGGVYIKKWVDHDHRLASSCSCARISPMVESSWSFRQAWLYAETDASLRVVIGWTRAVFTTCFQLNGLHMAFPAVEGAGIGFDADGITTDYHTGRLNNKI
jgi:hypothetical protein